MKKRSIAAVALASTLIIAFQNFSPLDKDAKEEMASRSPLLAIEMEGESQLRGKCEGLVKRNDQQCELEQRENDVAIETMSHPDTVYKLTQTKGDAFTGKGSLKLVMEKNQHDPSMDSKPKDKYQLNLITPVKKGTAPFELKQGKKRYLAFAMKLGADYEVPKGWLIHMQVLQTTKWQFVSSGNRPDDIQGMSYGIPLTLEMEPSSDPMSTPILALDMRSDKTIKYTGKKSDRLCRQPLKRDQWYHFVFELLPDPNANGRGKITMWINGQRVLSYQGPWSFTPGKIGQIKNELVEDFIVGLGAYRQRQDRKQKVLFDSIRYGKSLQSVSVDPARLKQLPRVPPCQ